MKAIRKHQTLILAMVSFLSFLYVLLVVFEVPLGEVVKLLGMTLLGFMLVFLLSGCFFILFINVKKWISLNKARGK